MRLFGRGGVAGRGRQAGFSLLEVLFTIAMLALLVGVLTTASSNLLDSRKVSAEDVFWKAVTEARKYALLSNRDVRLAFDSKEKAFHASTIDGTRRFPVPIEGDMKLEFLRTGTSGRSTILIGGVLVETEPLPFVTFYADGTCTPFRAQIRTGAGNQPRYLNIDPWTCAPVLESKDPYR